MSNLSRSMDESSTYGQHLWAHGHTLRPTMLSPHSPSRIRSRSPSLERRQQSLPKSPRSPRPERRMILGLQSHSAGEASLDHPQKRRLVLKSSHQSWPSSTKRYVTTSIYLNLYLPKTERRASNMVISFERYWLLRISACVLMILI